MTTIWNVEPDEMPQVFKAEYSAGRIATPESLAIRDLKEGKTIAFPCRWEHRDMKSKQRKDGSWSYHHVCMGTNFAHVTANREGFRIKSTCKDKIVYVQYKVAIQ